MNGLGTVLEQDLDSEPAVKVACTTRDIFASPRVGFAINLDTARKLRETLFLRRVLDSPHVNQADYLAGQRRPDDAMLV